MFYVTYRNLGKPERTPANMHTMDEAKATAAFLRFQGATAITIHPRAATLKYDFRSTPWGQAETVTEIAPGIYAITTASHGGIYLDDDRNAIVPLAVREGTFQSRDVPGHGRIGGQGVYGWYEEDCDAAIVYLVYKAEFDAYRRAHDPDDNADYEIQATRSLDPLVVAALKLVRATAALAKATA